MLLTYYRLKHDTVEKKLKMRASGNCSPAHRGYPWAGECLNQMKTNCCKFLYLIVAEAKTLPRHLIYNLCLYFMAKTAVFIIIEYFTSSPHGID